MPNQETQTTWKRRVGRGLRLIAQPKFFFYLLIYLMVLLVAGTISEKYIGLYLSQKLYFSSFIIWIRGFLPVPGGATILTLIFFNLLAKLVTEQWNLKRPGTLIVHCGALLLLFGGFLTSVISTNGSMVIDEGGIADYLSDYHKYELAVSDAVEPDRGEVAVFKGNKLKIGETLASSSVPFTLTVEHFYRNSAVVQRQNLQTDGSVHGMLVANEMHAEAPSADDSKNRAGLIFHISGLGPDRDGNYAIFESMPIEQSLTVAGKKYIITLRRQRTYLPFNVELVKFKREVYPGTEMARSFSSEVILHDENMQWRSLISMNHPLRYKGYIFYQSAFIEDNDGKTTILEVVKNPGAIFPYISSIIMCIGMLVHLFGRLPNLRNKDRGTQT